MHFINNFLKNLKGEDFECLSMSRLWYGATQRIDMHASGAKKRLSSWCTHEPGLAYSITSSVALFSLSLSNVSLSIDCRWSAVSEGAKEIWAVVAGQILLVVLQVAPIVAAVNNRLTLVSCRSVQANHTTLSWAPVEARSTECSEHSSIRSPPSLAWHLHEVYEIDRAPYRRTKWNYFVSSACSKCE